MDKHERQRIYTLLSKYFPNARQLRDSAALTAWGYVLERFAYEEVKHAVIDYAAQHRFFPDLADLTAGLRPVPRMDADRAAMRALVGPPCPILHSHPGEGLKVGELLKREASQVCPSCSRRSAPGGCTLRGLVRNPDAENAYHKL